MPMALKTDEIVNRIIGTSMNIRQSSNCKTKNAIYLVIRPCEKWYFGMSTRAIKTRVQHKIPNTF